MIPKVIHYCWFGNESMSALSRRCLDSWRIHLPGYEFRLWNETTFDIHTNKYVNEAYLSRKYAFVSDYIRLHVLYQYGGIYLDTDVELLKPLDELLLLPGFIGYESETELATSIIGSTPNNNWILEQLNSYKGRHFILGKDGYDLTTNVQIVSRNTELQGFKLENSHQIYKECMNIFPNDYFSPKSRTGIITITANTYCIHHFEGSWQNPTDKFKKFIFRKIVGPRLTDLLVNLKRRLINSHRP